MIISLEVCDSGVCYEQVAAVLQVRQAYTGALRCTHCRASHRLCRIVMCWR